MIGLLFVILANASPSAKDQKSKTGRWIESDYDRRVLVLHKGDLTVEYFLQRYGRNARGDSSTGGYIARGTYRLTSVNGAHALFASHGYSSIRCNYSIGIEGARGRSGLLIHDLSWGVRKNGRKATGQEYAMDNPHSQGCLVLSVPDMKSLLDDLGVRPGARVGCNLIVKGDGRKDYDRSTIHMDRATRRVVGP
jgi:hypothetical protein